MTHPSSGPAGRDFLFVQSTTEVGGAETVLLNLFEASAELRARGVVATLGFGSGDLPKRLRALGAEVVEIPRVRLREAMRLPRTFAALRTLARSLGVRVVIGNGAHPQVFGGLIARLSGARSAFLVHMIYDTRLWKNDPRDVLALRGPCDLMLAVSRAAQAPLGALRPKVRNQSFYAGTPHREVAAADVLGARHELGAGPDEVLFGVFGRLQRWKGQDVFVEAAAEVARARPRTRFAVVGGSVFGLEPEFFTGLQRRAEELGLGDRIRFTGFRTDAARLMAACDVVCHTTRVAEPFGMVVIEAMDLGRPVVATKGGGPSEVISSDETGILVPPDDVGALARTMIGLVDDPARRRRLGLRGAERVRADFTTEAGAASLLHHLKSLM
jgi:glycosyltransferase involved in cell wall biosynthesis